MSYGETHQTLTSKNAKVAKTDERVDRLSTLSLT